MSEIENRANNRKTHIPFGFLTGCMEWRAVSVSADLKTLEMEFLL